MPCQRTGEIRRAAARKGPALLMRDDSQDEAESGAGHAFERQHGVGCEAREKGARPLAAKGVLGDARGRAQHGQPETRRHQGMRGDTKRILYAGLELGPGRKEPSHEPAIPRAVVAEIRRACVNDRSLAFAGRWLLPGRSCKRAPSPTLRTPSYPECPAL